MIKNETKNEVSEMMNNFLNSLEVEMQDLQYEELLLESELKNCEDEYLYNKAMHELITVRVKLSVLKDINGVL